MLPGSKIEDQNKISIEQLLKEGKTVQFHPIGTSMWPLFMSPMDYAIVAPIGEHRLKRGDVCLYRKEILILHRLHHVHKLGATQKLYFIGDHQTSIEQPIEVDQVIGIMVGFIRCGHTFSVDNIGYKVCATIWLWLRPCRTTLIGIGSRIKRAIFWSK